MDHVLDHRHRLSALADMVNGQLTNLLLWAASGLVGVAGLLFGVVMRMHASRDDERYANTMRELQSLRDRMHSTEGASARIETLLRWKDEDKGKGP